MRLLVALSLLAVLAGAVPMPEQLVMSAPYTPFKDGKVNLEAVEKLAAHHSKWGANSVWVAGGMGQYNLLTTDERKALHAEWIKQGKKYGLYMMIHVGSQGNQSQSIELARHAYEQGADSVCAIPAFLLQPKNWDDVIAYFKPVLAAAPGLPFFYYHIPGSTGVQLPVYDFLTKAKTELPELKGIKYVEDAWQDWMYITQEFNDAYKLLFAPEPKLRALPFAPAKGATLAESFYAPTWIRMERAFKRGDFAAAAKEQVWKYSAEGVFGKYPGSKRAIFREIADVDIGPGRGEAPFNNDNWGPLLAELEEISFVTQSLPPYQGDDSSPKSTDPLVIAGAVLGSVAALALACFCYRRRTGKGERLLREQMRYTAEVENQS